MNNEPEDDYRKNFAIMIPQQAFKPVKPRKFKPHDPDGIGLPRYRFPKWLDKLLKPFCQIGLHRWVGTYAFTSFTIADYGKPGSKSTNPVTEQHYACARCKKHKTKKL